MLHQIKAFFRSRCNASNEFHPFSAAVGGYIISDIGLKRSHNEDNFLFGNHFNENAQHHVEIGSGWQIQKSNWIVFGIFDGMGGCNQGEVASRIAAKCFQNKLESVKSDATTYILDNVIRQAFQEANDEIVVKNKTTGIIGTTGTILCFADSAYKIFYLGDTRVYSLTDEALSQLTTDQTLAQMKIDSGLFQENDPRLEADRHKLTDFIGRDIQGGNLRPRETLWVPLKIPGSFLLCSDGLYNMCADSEMSRIMCSEATIAEKAISLVSHAMEYGGDDNITCILIDTRSDDEI